MRYIKIMSLEYSGSTLVDLILGQSLRSCVSLGEVERTIEPDSKQKVLSLCSCGDDKCKYWGTKADSYTGYYDYLAKSFPNAFFIDSSKTLTSLNKLHGRPFTVIYLYRECFPWVQSCIKRYLKTEVDIRRSNSKAKMILPFIRIEILRRLLFPLPFEWLTRNIRLVVRLATVSKYNGSAVYAISYESIAAELNGTEIHYDNAHIKRGNRISKSKAKIFVRRTNSRQTIFDAILRKAISMTALTHTNGFSALKDKIG